MIYVILVLISILMTHSIYSLVIKYANKPPLWFILYIVIWFGLVTLTPMSIALQVGELFGLSSAVNAWFTLIVVGIICLIIFNTFPKSKIDKNIYD